MIFFFFSFCNVALLQPARLNVFKNDQDTWDYTNPNLSGQGNMQFLNPPSLLLLPPLLSCHCVGWSAFSASGGIVFVHRTLLHHSPCCSTQCSEAIFLLCLYKPSYICSPCSRLKVRAWGETSRAAKLQRQARACEKPKFTFPVEHVTAAQPHNLA